MPIIGAGKPPIGLSNKPGRRGNAIAFVAVWLIVGFLFYVWFKSMNEKPKASVNPLPETLTYYIAADEVNWDYAPKNKNRITNSLFKGAELITVGKSRYKIGKVYKKALFQEYKDDTFKVLKEKDIQSKYNGFLGPLIRAEVGDTVRVVFKNNTRVPLNLHPEGLQYDKASEGAQYFDRSSGGDIKDNLVLPGKTYTYIWQVPYEAGPGPGDPSTILWPYYSNVSAKDISSGLVGPILVARAGLAKKDGSPKDIKREFITMLTIVDENNSHYLEENIQNNIKYRRYFKPESAEFKESNVMYSINGYVFGNLPILTMDKGERVRWHFMNLGTINDSITLNWEGFTGLRHKHRTNSVFLPLGSIKSFDITPEKTGIWLFESQIPIQKDRGLQGRVEVISPF